MKSWVYGSSFKTRLWLSFVMLVTFSVAISGLTSHYMASRILERKAKNLSQGMINKSAQALQEKLRKVRLAALTVTMNEPFNRIEEALRNRSELSDYERFSIASAMKNAIFQMKLIEPAIDSVLIETPIGEYHLESDKRIPAVELRNNVIFEQMENQRFPVWMESHEDPFFEGKTRVLTLLTKPASSDPTSGIYVLVNVKEESLRDYILENLGEDGGDILVMNRSGAIALDTESELAMTTESDFVSKLTGETGHFEYKHRGETYLVHYAGVFFPDNWTVVNIQSMGKLLKDVNRIRWLTVGTIMVFILLASVLSKKLTSVLLHPLIRLQQLMRRAEQNDLGVRYESAYRDEFTQVGQRFNRMLEEIEALICNVKEAEMHKRKAEVKALQSQIDPHFLYNTLNTILWKSESGDHEEVREMIMSLSLLFRLGLNNGNELTTVRKEIEHVTQYLRIQKLCYEDLFDYDIQIADPSLLDEPILKLLLQPIVENAILHGFRDGVPGGVIRIAIKRTPSQFLIRVEDNGKGFDAKAVQIRLAEGPSQKGGYALRNVYDRLLLYYGKEASLGLDSVPYERTIVTIAIPLGPAPEIA